jgi:hypothetical protein
MRGRTSSGLCGQVWLHAYRAHFSWKYTLIDGASLSNESGLIAFRIQLRKVYDLAHLILQAMGSVCASCVAVGDICAGDAFVTFQLPLTVGTIGQPLGNADLRVDLTGSHRDAGLLTGRDDLLHAQLAVAENSDEGNKHFWASIDEKTRPFRTCRTRATGWSCGDPFGDTEGTDGCSP